jgi:hypothetical protein
MSPVNPDPQGFYDPFDDPPDWNDGGRTLFRKGDKVSQGYLLIDEQWTGEEEIPSPQVTLDDGSKPSFYDFDGWKPVS